MKSAASGGLLDRTVQQRDARVFVIAVEGEEDGEECVYFTALEEQWLVDRRRVKILPLAADPALHDSAPTQVLARLDEHCRRHRIREEFDQLWLVFDVDTWKEGMLSSVAQEALQRGYRLAVSNPCFELWLVLHGTDDLSFLSGFGPPKRSGETKSHLRRLRAQGACAITSDGIWQARARACGLDRNPRERWPTSTGTHIYRLIDALADARALVRPG